MGAVRKLLLIEKVLSTASGSVMVALNTSFHVLQPVTSRSNFQMVGIEALITIDEFAKRNAPSGEPGPPTTQSPTPAVFVWLRKDSVETLATRQDPLCVKLQHKSARQATRSVPM